jgi:hypothetical protein
LLNANSLQSDLKDLFANPPLDESACAQKWGQAMVDFTASVVPASTTGTAAGSALTAALQGMHESGAAAQKLENAFVAFAVALEGGMSAAGYSPMPTPRPQVGFSDPVGGLFTTPDAAASAIVAKIVAWAPQQEPVLIASSTPTPWS